jgi:hypothetical protein
MHKQNYFISARAGFSLVEVMVGLGFATMLCLLGYSAVNWGQSRTHKIENVFSQNTGLQLLKLKLQSLLEVAFPGPVWLNQTVGQHLQLQAPWLAPDGKPAGSVLVRPNWRLQGVTSAAHTQDTYVADPTNQFDLVVLIAGVPNSVAQPTCLTPLAIGASQTAVDVPMGSTADLTNFMAGDMVGMKSTFGIQMGAVTGVTPGASPLLSLQALGTYTVGPLGGLPFPTRFIQGATNVFRVQSTLIGVDENRHLNILQTERDGTFRRIFFFETDLLSLKVVDRTLTPLTDATAFPKTDNSYLLQVTLDQAIAIEGAQVSTRLRALEIKL